MIGGRSRRRRTAARTAATLGILVVATASFGTTSFGTASFGTASRAATPATTSGSATSGSATSVPAIALLSQSAWVGPTGVFDLRVAAPLAADAQIQARIYVPISTQDQLTTTSEGESLGELVEQVTVPGAEVTKAADGSFRLGYPMVADSAAPVYGFHLSNPGVYPFELRILSADGSVTADLVTQLIRLPAEQSAIPAISLAVVVPYGAPVSRSPDQAPHLAPSTLSALAAETVAFHRDRTVPIAVAPVPETIDTLAELDRASGSHKVADLADAIGKRTVVPGPMSHCRAVHGWPTGWPTASIVRRPPVAPPSTRSCT